jgi:nicotinate-nucleotide adenylyltransferase
MQDTAGRIGIFGGTFNPVHMGHVRAVEEIREQCSLERVLFIPSYVPPHKKKLLTPAAHRYAMVNRAIAGNRAFAASDIELTRQGSSYAVDTVAALKEQYRHTAHLYFILGSDAFQEIQTWREYERLFALCNVVVMSRPGSNQAWGREAIPPAIRAAFSSDGAAGSFRHSAGTRLHFCAITALDISSSAIRQRLREGRTIKYLVAEAVERYIQEHQLYGIPD